MSAITGSDVFSVCHNSSSINNTNPYSTRSVTHNSHTCVLSLEKNYYKVVMYVMTALKLVFARTIMYNLKGYSVTNKKTLRERNEIYF